MCEDGAIIDDDEVVKALDKNTLIVVMGNHESLTTAAKQSDVETEKKECTSGTSAVSEEGWCLTNSVLATYFLK